MNIFQYFVSFIFNLFNPANNYNVPPTNTKPHIVVIVTDDMGWNDVGFHGSNEIPTPNIDALAYSGVILNRHYVLPTCTPSRTAFLTGRHPIRMGMQGLPLNVAEPRGIPLREKLLPEYLRNLGYVTRLVGKWHLGYYTEKHTPTRRGFDSFTGYYGGYIKYFNHSVTKNKHTGADFHLDTPTKIEPHKSDQYFTDFITNEAEEIIKNHEKQKPLYLHLSHLAAHASEGVNPIEVRNLTDVNNTLGYIPDMNRRRYAGVVTALDESVGKVVKALSDANMLNNSIIVFMSDNGAPTAIAPFSNSGSNYPFRGLKATLFEGGVRVPSFVFSPLLKNHSRVIEEYIHITDWLPTLYKLAGGNLDKINNIDGIDQWSTISNAEKSKRDSVFLNIDEVLGYEAAILGQYKLLRGARNYKDYYASSGIEHSPKVYNITRVTSSLTGTAIKKLSIDYLPNEKQVIELRKEASVHCERKTNYSQCLGTCIFNVVEDPCETTDISDEHPEMIAALNLYLNSFRSVLMNQTNTYIDSAGYPEHFNGYWMPWMEREYTPPKDRNKSIIWSPNVFCEGFPIDDPRNCL